MILKLREAPGGCILPVRVHPGAKRDAITGVHDGALKISLTTPPTDGRANEALVAFLSERLGIPRARIELLTGASSRSKAFRIFGMTTVEVEEKLLVDLA
ncbi:MAG TPA: DUF167 domain-containing protein [Acidobacteriaceae bacterium]